MSELNQYGDRFQPTKDGRGVDIASQRQDELDAASLAYIARLVAAGQAVCAVDLGGGFGAHSIRMAQAGACVTMVDLQDTAAQTFVQSGLSGNLCLVQKDFTALTRADMPDGFDVLYSQRAIHYVPYDAAADILSLMSRCMKGGGRLYLSAAGYDTEYGITHPDRQKPVAARFDYIAPDMRVKHGITQKIVIYKAEELTELLSQTGFSDIRIKRSAFGNMKAYAIKA